jgi:hypothetical protein
MKGPCFPASKLFRAITLLAAVCSTFPLAQQASAQQQTAPAAPLPLITQPVNESQLTVLKGNTHPLARPQFDLGTAPATLPMQRMLLVLKRSPQQESALDQLLNDQQDKSSPNYHKWLTPDQFGQQFGPTDADLQTITAWLQSHGFQVGSTKGRTTLEFSGSASQVQAAFHTTIHKYIVNGEQHWANASDPQIPSALTPAISGVASLNNFTRKPMNLPLGTFSRDKTTGRFTPIKPLYTFPSGCVENNNVNQGYCSYGIGPYDFATIYNVLPLWNANINGTGQTIAIVGESNINPQDIADFRTLFGLPANSSANGNPLNIILNGPDPGIQGDESEADIDVTWSGSVAPYATIDFVVSQSTETTTGTDLSAVYIVENNLAAVMSESYGECELGLGTSGNQFYNTLWQQASAQGITVFISAGDAGSAGCDDFDAAAPIAAQFGLQVSGYASTPYNVAVGGTDFNDFTNPATYWNLTNNSTTQASAKGYIPETTWNDSCTNAIFATIGYSTSAETNCNNSQLSNFVDITGGSGGASNCTTPAGSSPSNCAGGYSKPSWQTGTGVPNDGKRDLPDVSLFASNGFLGSFYLICQSDQTQGACNVSNEQFLGFGGTSVSSPAFAGIMALVNQQTGSRQGNANYILYKLAAKETLSNCNSTNTPATTCIFNDITMGTNAMPCAKGSPNCTTSAGDIYGILTGYNAGTGYDQATGLGSVNANNLVTQWSSVTFLPSTTTLNSLTPTTLAHGQPVTFSGTVSPQSGTGTPTGQISLLGGPANSKGIADFAVTSGSFSGTTDLLPGGAYSVIAHYPGDSTYAASDSGPISVDVTPETSKTFPNLVTFNDSGNLTSFTATSATYGSGYYLFRIDVGNSAATVSSTTGVSSTCSNRTASCPTGTVALTVSGTSFNGTSLLLNSEGFAENQSFPPGSYVGSASYSGDASYSASNGTVNFTVAKAPTTASAGYTFSVQYGDSEPISASITTTSIGIAPTGTVQFSLDGSPINGLSYGIESGPGNPNSTTLPYAWLNDVSSTEFLSLGNHSLTVQYSGDTYYAASTSPVTTVTVTQAQPNFLTYGWDTPTAAIGQTVTPTGTIYGAYSGVQPTGSLTFFDNGIQIPGNVTYTGHSGTGPGGSGSQLTGTTSYTFTTPGTHSLTINYSGDTYYLPTSTGSPNTLNVAGPVTVTPSSTVNITSPGQSGSTTLTLTANQGFSGTVALSCSPDANAKESNCNFTSGTTTGSTLQVNLTGATATATFTVTTTAPHSDAKPHALVLPSATGIGLVGIVMILTLTNRVSRKRFLPAIAIGLVVALSACGGGSGNSSGDGGSGGGGGGGNTDPGTPAGQYTFTVTSVTGSGSSALTVTTPVTVTVQ